MTAAATRPSPSSAHRALTGADLSRLRARSRRRPRAGLAVLGLTLLGAMAVRVLLGTYTVTIPDFLTILGGGTVDAAPAASFIVMEDKLPHAVLGALAGLAFGAAGAVFQLLLRNPLASPDVIGISASASLGAIASAAFFGAAGLGLAAGGLIGAGLAAVAVFLLSVSGRAAGAPGAGDAVGGRFILTGLGISVLAIAVTNYLLSRMSVYQAADAAIWLTGSLGAASWQRIGLTGAALIALLPLLAVLSRPLHAMAVGEELAAGLGVPVTAVRWLGIGLATALAAVAVSMTGPIAFVAFVSGPVARRLSGGRHTLVGSALVGAILVVLADFTAANLIPGGRLPVGVITGLVGAPVLLWLVAGDHKERT